jgi:sulfate adenylyltransferase subunit 1 (EFTu-like GTPase family)
MDLKVVIVGHTGHGRLTLIGRLLYDSAALSGEHAVATARILFKGRDYYTVVDVPDHHGFTKDTTSQAQVAVLVISCVDGIQEQTRQHVRLVNKLGIKEIITAINKLDLVDYDEGIYRRTKGEVAGLLASLGYTGNRFVPISAMQGDNIYKPSERTYWYHGPTLIEVLDAIQPDEIAERVVEPSTR